MNPKLSLFALFSLVTPWGKAIHVPSLNYWTNFLPLLSCLRLKNSFSSQPEWFLFVCLFLQHNPWSWTCSLMSLLPSSWAFRYTPQHLALGFAVFQLFIYCRHQSCFRCWSGIYFLPFLRLSLHPLIASFAVQKLFISCNPICQLLWLFPEL